MDCPRLMTFGLAESSRDGDGREGEERCARRTRSCQLCHVSLTSLPSTALLFRGSASATPLSRQSDLSSVPSVRRCNQHLVRVNRHPSPESVEKKIKEKERGPETRGKNSPVECFNSSR